MSGCKNPACGKPLRSAFQAADGRWHHHVCSAECLAARALVPCEVCGKPLGTGAGWAEPYDLVCAAACFTEKFWRLEVPKLDHVDLTHEVFVANGNSYSIGNEGGSDDGGLRGFGGAVWWVMFADGHVVRTSNLWHGGDVPASFRDRIKDTATLLAPKPGEDEVLCRLHPDAVSRDAKRLPPALRAGDARRAGQGGR